MSCCDGVLVVAGENLEHCWWLVSSRPLSIVLLVEVKRVLICDLNGRGSISSHQQRWECYFLRFPSVEFYTRYFFLLWLEWAKFRLTRVMWKTEQRTKYVQITMKWKQKIIMQQITTSSILEFEVVLWWMCQFFFIIVNYETSSVTINQTSTETIMSVKCYSLF